MQLPAPDPHVSALATQKIFRIRRDYNSWVANETLEDYSLRYTPRHFRKWSEFRVANTAFGATSFLALEAIGAAIALSYGFTNALWAIVVVGIITFVTGLPISYYAARHGVDMDLLTRGSGFGYLGSTVTSLIYASFTFIFFALEAAILALALQMATQWPLWLCYLAASLGIVPLVMHGITLISRLQLWTQPLWIAMFVIPYVYIVVQEPERFAQFTSLAGRVSGGSTFDATMFGAAATVAFSLVVQIGEQVDYLRFLPEKTRENRLRWWAAVLVAGPGWVLPGMVKMMAGAFLAFLVLQHSPEHALDPTQMYLTAYGFVFDDARWALAAAVVFVVVSQVKINVTNAYAGSLAWSNFFARMTHSHPGRVVWLVFNVMIAGLLMSIGVLGAIEPVLGLYANVAIAWVGALVADLMINKPLGWSPKGIEFRRAYLYDVNPVGTSAMALAALVSIAAYAGALGKEAQAWAPFIALLVALGASPLIAWWTRGRWYLARRDPAPWHPGQRVPCSVCDNEFESEDMAHCSAYGAPICSLCCTLESRCHDRCKSGSRAGEQLRSLLEAVWPSRRPLRVHFRVAQYLVVALSVIALVGTILGIVYAQQSALAGGELRPAPFLQAFALLSIAAAVGAWWMVLGSESRQMAQDESNRQNQLLVQEIEAHRRTDAALQAAKDSAEAANQAKTRYVAGMTHELRTPLNGILGYAQILRKDDRLPPPLRTAIATIHHSSEHMSALIDDLLDLARIEAGRMKLDPAPMPMPEFLDDLARMVAPQAAAKGLAFELVTQGQVPACVRADEGRLRQVLINLLGNALRYTERGRVTLRVDCSREVMRIDVSDTGIGIAKEDLERIFEPFERGSGGRRSSERGTGLGLTITRLLTQLMGGDLAVRSSPGVGSTFTLRLYLRAIAKPDGGRVLRQRPVVGYLGPRRTLLVVDDQITQRHMLAGMLMPLGFEVTEAASGHECLQSVEAQAPDAVLLDISMDDLDGWETARRLRAQGAAMPILIVSANAFENDPHKLTEAGCQAFVDKPVIESQLLGALQRHLELEWVTDLKAPGWNLTLLETISTAPLPPGLSQSLLSLVRAGHVRGLREALEAFEGTHPASKDCVKSLLGLLDRHDWPGLLERLRHAADEGEENAGEADLPEART